MDRITLQAFITKYGLSMAELEWADRNPNMVDDGWAQSASHYKLRIRCKGRQLTTYFSMGSAHTSEPKLADVLDCLSSDASGVENARSFEDWCAEYGYDTDSRRAEKTFKACERSAESLKRLLTPDVYEQLLWHTERL